MNATTKKVVKSRFECDEDDKKVFNDSSCVILVSVGQAAHEDEKLAATIERCVKDFKAVSVAVCDSLQRHSIQVEHDIPYEKAYLLSNQLGDEWINKYTSLLDECNAGFFRWDSWLTRKDFEENRNIIIEAYNSNKIFKTSMDLTVDDYASRVLKRASKSISCLSVKKASFAYLVEECAIIMLMWQRMAYNYIVYPSPILDVMGETHRIFVAPKEKRLLKWARIKLKTKQVNMASVANELV